MNGFCMVLVGIEKGCDERVKLQRCNRIERVLLIKFLQIFWSSELSIWKLLHRNPGGFLTILYESSKGQHRSGSDRGMEIFFPL